MQYRRIFFKTTALLSSVTLFAGFVAFRAGALNGFVTAGRSSTVITTATSMGQNPRPRFEDEFNFRSQDQAQSFNAEFFPVPTVMYSSKSGGILSVPPPSISNSTVMSGSKAGIGIIIPSSHLPTATPNHDQTTEYIVSQNTVGTPVGLHSCSDPEAQARFHALAGSKTITGLIQPSDLAVVSKQFANPVPKKSKPTDITPLFQGMFSQHETPTFSPMIVSTKSAVLDWSPPVMLFEQVPVYVDQTPATEVMLDEASSSATAPQSPAKKPRRAVLSGSKSFVIPIENALK